MDSDKFFQFPISALRLGKKLDEVTTEEKRKRISYIMSYCSYEMGLHRAASMNDSLQKKTALDYISRNKTTSTRSKDETLVALGAEYLGINFSDLRNAYSEWKAINDGAVNLKVRVRFDLFWDMLNVDEWTWRQVAVCAAVYAGIGAAKKSRLTFERLACLSIGYLGQRTIVGIDHVPTRCQVRYTVNQLQERGLFVRASPDKRHNYYSHRLTLDGLAESLVADLQKKQVTASQITERIRKKAVKEE
jgi:hypothetical protein